MKIIQADTILLTVKQVTALLLAAIFSVLVLADDGGQLHSVEGDGWHRWSVDAVDNAPSWCCYTWRNKDVQSTACQLDDDINSYGSSKDDQAVTANRIQIFAKLKNGRVERLHAFGCTCEVNTNGKIADHGQVDTADSLKFLGKLLSGERKLVGQSLAAISVHNSNEAQSMLEASSRTTEPVKTRKDAIFWMGQVRAQQSVNALKRIMFKDEVDEVREHTVFSVSQSSLGNRLALIEQVARKDPSKKVRGQAWFWMAQTGEGDAEQRILTGIEAESSQAVREQAVFALSQLEGDAGTNALIRVIETPEFNRKVRKQALFWLAQSDSDRAADYLENVLDR